ncbi:hypothetical protein CATYP_05560 [Corynebacterium atypicum]|uniref:AbiEi antitoxin C-terminal domain-containing protein n=1 Tax=Corynebacterium atypicum TaxID=191610 RepID=A0ABN4DCL4_9CORY|nr:hypothetical protein [Corynebacterium atypicum]AIG64170.1 hypothetical protein CATYP_05560 [Corynebacterium atypicum]
MSNRGFTEGIIFTKGFDTTSRKTISRHTARGKLVKLAPQAYIPATAWYSATALQKLSIRAAAHQLTTPGSVITGAAAAQLHGITVDHLVDHTRIDIAVDQKSRRKPRHGVVFHRLTHHLLTTSRLHQVHNATVRVADPAPAVVDIARFHGTVPGLVATEHAWHNRKVTQTGLLAAASEIGRCAGSRRARHTVDFAGPWSESPRESELKLRLHREGFPPPVQQARIFDSLGGFVARPDFFFPEVGLIIEYEGAQKTEGPLAGLTAVRELERVRAFDNLGLVVRHVDAIDFRSQ